MKDADFCANFALRTVYFTLKTNGVHFLCCTFQFHYCLVSNLQIFTDKLASSTQPTATCNCKVFGTVQYPTCLLLLSPSKQTSSIHLLISCRIHTFPTLIAYIYTPVVAGITNRSLAAPGWCFSSDFTTIGSNLQQPTGQGILIFGIMNSGCQMVINQSRPMWLDLQLKTHELGYRNQTPITYS